MFCFLENLLNGSDSVITLLSNLCLLISGTAFFGVAVSADQVAQAWCSVVSHLQVPWTTAAHPPHILLHIRFPKRAVGVWSQMEHNSTPIRKLCPQIPHLLLPWVHWIRTYHVLWMGTRLLWHSQKVPPATHRSAANSNPSQSVAIWAIAGFQRCFLAVVPLDNLSGTIDSQNNKWRTLTLPCWEQKMVSYRKKNRHPPWFVGLRLSQVRLRWWLFPRYPASFLHPRTHHDIRQSHKRSLLLEQVWR